MAAISKRPVWGAIAAVAAIGIVGAMHAPCARGLLARVGGCPFAGAHMTAVQADVARHMALAQTRPEGVAPARPALGFALDVTTLADARRWARAQHVGCEEPREGLMRCRDVASAALGLAPSAGPAGELALEFDPQGRLVDATTFRSRLSPEAASAAAAEIATSLGRTLGDPARRTGSFDVAHLSQPAAESIATLSYRYGDYVADVTAMHLPSGVTVREQYMSARD